MKFGHLYIRNFLSIEEASVNLADRGLVLIQGVNEDNTSAVSNGSGKSSVPDALCWVLYGATARGVSGDAVVNRAAGKDCRVVISLVDGANAFKIERHRKARTHKNALMVFKVHPDGTEDALTKGNDKLTQELVNQIIGSSYEVFRSAVYAGQEQMPDLPAMTDKQLKMLVEEAAGVTVLEAAYREALTEASAYKTAIDTAQRKVDRHSENLSYAKGVLLGNQANSKTFELDRTVRSDNLHAEVLKISERCKEVSDEIASHKPVEFIADMIKDLEAKISAVDGERAKEKVLEKAVRDAEINLLNVSTKAKTWRNEHDTAKANLEKVGTIVGTPCRECGKAYCEADIADTKKRLTDRLAEVVSRAPELKSLAEDAKKRAGSARETLEEFRVTMTDVSATSAQIAPLRVKMAKVKDLQADLKVFGTEIASRHAGIKRINEQPNPFTALIEDDERKIKVMESEVRMVEEELGVCQDRLKEAELVVKVFSPAGVRAHILDEVTPFLNDQTAKYLSSLTDGNTTATWSTLVRTAKGDLREKFTIEVTDTTGGESFAALSGGEKRKVRIAAALALQDMVARRATKPLELFIGDEIDDALDEAGLERLTQILEEKARERGSVFIISHNSLTDWVSKVITVTKKDGKSVIHEGEEA